RRRRFVAPRQSFDIKEELRAYAAGGGIISRGAASTGAGCAASAGPGRRLRRSTSARSSPACAAARRAARRHLPCLIQAAMPPTTTPPIKSTCMSRSSGSARVSAGQAGSHGAREATTLWPLATARLIAMIASGTRISAVTILRSMTSGARAIEPLAHFLAGLEERHRLLLHRDVGAGARVAPGPRRAVLDGEGAKAPQPHPAAARHRCDD